METLTLNEDQLVDAVCLFHAKFKSVEPSAVEVELGYEDDLGYFADAYLGSEETHYASAQFLTALRLYIDEQLGRDSMSARIQLDIDDSGMIAHIEF